MVLALHIHIKLIYLYRLQVGAVLSSMVEITEIRHGVAIKFPNN